MSRGRESRAGGCSVTAHESWAQPMRAASTREMSTQTVSRVAGVGEEHLARRVGDGERRREAITAACGVTPQAQNTGTSPGSASTGSPKSGRSRSSMPSAAGSPQCTGRAVHGRQQAALPDRGLDQVLGRHRPHRHHHRAVHPSRGPALAGSSTYIGTLRPCSMWRIGTPASVSAHSKVKLHPMRNDTRSSRQCVDARRSARRPARRAPRPGSAAGRCAGRRRWRERGRPGDRRR